MWPSHPRAGSLCLGTTVTLEPHRSYTFSLNSAPSPLDAELCPERTTCALSLGRGKSWSQSILTISGTSESPAPPGPQCWCWCWHCGNTGILPSHNAVPHTPWHSRLSVTIATQGSSLFPSWPPADCYRAKLSPYPNHASNKRPADTKLYTMSSRTLGLQRTPNTTTCSVRLEPWRAQASQARDVPGVPKGTAEEGLPRGLHGWGMWYVKPLGWEVWEVWEVFWNLSCPVWTEHRWKGQRGETVWSNAGAQEDAD